MAGRTLKWLAAAAVVVAILVAFALYRDLTSSGRTSADDAPPSPRPLRVETAERRPTPAAPPQPAILVAPLPFGAGERLAYTVRWSGMEAGRLTLQVAAGNSADTLRLVGEGATRGFVRAAYDAHVETVITCTATTLLPIEVRRETRDPNPRVEAAYYRHAVRLVEIAGTQLPIAADARDPVTALYALRAVDFGAVGEAVTFAVNELGAAFAVHAEVVERADGAVRLEVVAVGPGGPGSEFRGTVLLEAGGSRRILALSAVTPAGEILLTLDQPAP